MGYQSSRIHTETQLKSQKLGFSAAYLAVQYLASHIKTHPQEITWETFQALLTAVESPGFAKKKQALFFYAQLFETLVEMAVSPCPVCGQTIVRDIQSRVLSSHGPVNRAASQALGRLPIAFPAHPACSPREDATPVPFDQLIKHAGVIQPGVPHWKGRSLIFPLKNGDTLSLKFATSKENIPILAEEMFWMEELHHHPPCTETRFQLPRPVAIQGNHLFLITDLPGDATRQSPLDIASSPMVAFVSPGDYYAYPNDAPSIGSSGETLEIFLRNARLLGRLTGKGIIHTALIPLFHNRVQRDRRQDQGRYQWELGGRLDQWLDSCQYPNFAKSGLRDFEHMSCLENEKGLHHFIGEHILSFILVMGSYFRAKAPTWKASRLDAPPLDTRSWFDPCLFADLIKGVVREYCLGMNNRLSPSLEGLPYDLLTTKLIEKMGLDEDMEETLRMRDQETMSQDEFETFLRARGVKEPGKFERAKADIQLITGPHLGGFNQPISVPELIEFLFCISGICLADRYLLETQ
ncbi:MAG: SidJ-related pseudokinase [Desulfobacterales bacterium]|nr:SidJ-related pseudokinase [Desulfobacterales bacterium]